MADSRLDQVIAALITLFGAAPGLSGVHVADGIEASEVDYAEQVIVAASLEDDGGLVSAAQCNQDWHDMGPAAKRDELGSIPVTVIVQSGAEDLATVRIRCGVLAGVVVSTVRGDDLGLADLLWAHSTSVRLVQGRNSNGVYAAKVITVSYHALV